MFQYQTPLHPITQETPPEKHTKKIFQILNKVLVLPNKWVEGQTCMKSSQTFAKHIKLAYASVKWPLMDRGCQTKALNPKLDKQCTQACIEVITPSVSAILTRRMCRSDNNQIVSNKISSYIKLEDEYNLPISYA